MKCFRWRCYVNNSFLVFHQGTKHSKTIKHSRFALVFHTVFSCLDPLMKHSNSLFTYNMNNVKSIITKHNAHIIRNSQSQNTETDNCNCDNKNTCPLPKQCMTNNIIYKATVTTNNTNDTKHYIGMTATTFKERYANHTSSFRHKKDSNKTELSKHIWKLKENNQDYTIKW